VSVKRLCKLCGMLCYGMICRVCFIDKDGKRYSVGSKRPISRLAKRNDGRT
jgi:hypothetical protein